MKELDRLVDELFPILLKGGNDRQKVYFPWGIVAAHEKQAMRNHGGQTLKRLAERQGLSPCELAAVLEDREWHPMGDAAAWRSIYRAALAVRTLPTSEAAVKSTPEVL